MKQERAVEREEEARGSDDEKKRDIEDARLPPHHNSPVAVETVFARKHLPLPRHFRHLGGGCGDAAGTFVNQFYRVFGVYNFFVILNHKNIDINLGIECCDY